MSQLTERVEKTIKAIAKAEAKGRDTTEWQERLMELVNEVSATTVKVKAGKFGFCTCSQSDIAPDPLCCGCWRVRSACNCREVDVDPEEELTRQISAHVGGVH